MLGEGGWAAYASAPARLALLGVLLALFAAAYFAGGSMSAGVREDRGNRWVLIAFSVGGLAIGVVPAYCERAHVWLLDGSAVAWTGVLLFGLGGALRLWPVHVLGKRFSGLVAIQPGHTLMTQGIYSRIRHPSYLGLLISTLGWCLAFRSAVGLILTAAMIPPLVARMNSEERLLTEQFGDEYRAYRARTSRLIPWLY